jgi:hypothetical protein
VPAAPAVPVAPAAPAVSAAAAARVPEQDDDPAAEGSDEGELTAAATLAGAHTAAIARPATVAIKRRAMCARSISPSDEPRHDQDHEPAKRKERPEWKDSLARRQAPADHHA